MNDSLGRFNFSHEINQPDEKIDLAKAALFIAQEEYPDLEVEVYLRALDSMAEEVRKRLPESSYPLKIIQTINQYLYEDLGFKGNTDRYYDPRNSFLNDVIERRTGIPITVSLVYLEIARRINFPMIGIGMPGHFIIRPNVPEVEFFVDAFNQGEVLFEQDCEERLSQIYQQPITLEPELLQPVKARQILMRMLTNLKYIYLNRQQFAKALAVVERIVLLFPDHPIELRDRGLLYYQLEEWQKAIADFEIYLAMLPNATDASVIQRLLLQIQYSQS